MSSRDTAHLLQRRLPGLHQRMEWEDIIAAGHPDFSKITEPALTRIFDEPTLRHALAPIFTTEVRRTEWHLAWDNGDRIELAGVLSLLPLSAAIAAEIEQELGGGCLNLAGRTSVRELQALIRRCNFFITNDSGPMHLAAAFGVPLVAIFGSTDHATTYPLAEHALIVRESVDCAPCKKRECPTDHRCMTAVTAERVIEVARDLRHRVATAGSA